MVAALVDGCNYIRTWYASYQESESMLECPSGAVTLHWLRVVPDVMGGTRGVVVPVVVLRDLGLVTNQAAKVLDEESIVEIRPTMPRYNQHES